MPALPTLSSPAIARYLKNADLSGYPTSNPGSNKPWFNNGVMGIGAFSRGDMPIVLATGLSPSDGAANRTALQTQLDAAITAGQSLLLPVGTYPINATGTGNNRWCLSPTDKTKFFSLIIPPGCTLKIANSQVTDGNPVAFLALGAHTGGSYIGWPYGGMGGKLDGNTANQPGWTAGYAQTDGNLLISALDGSNDIHVDNLQLYNCFSNPINIGGNNEAYGENQRVRLTNLYAYNFGEGIQVISTDSVHVENVEQVFIRANWVGDGLELATCQNVIIRGLITRSSDGLVATTGGGGADLYCCKNVVMDGFLFEGVIYPFQIQTNFNDNTIFPDNISINNGIVKSSKAWTYLTNGHINFSNVQFLNSEGSGVQMIRDYASGFADYSFSDCRWTGNTFCSVGDNVKFRLKNCIFEDTSTGSIPDAIFNCSSCELDFDGVWVSASNAATGLILLNNNDTLTGRAVNIHAPSVNDANGYVVTVGTGTTYSGFILRGEGLVSVAGTPDGIIGATYWEGAGTLTSANMPKGTKGQRLQVSGRFQTTLNHGARLQLANAANFEIPIDTQNHIILEYDSVNDKWREISRSIVTVGSRIVPLPGQWSVSSPAANSTIEMGPAVYLTRACSLRELAAYMGDTNPTAGTATIEARIWGTPVNSLVAVYLGASTGLRTTGVDAIAAGSKLQLVLVTSADFAHNGTTITASGTLWE